ncbi:MAG TPA: alpha/beta hydrolase family protein [Candidatus Cryosericum sp.]|nr:alpha/beta hydrolase family protein [Candidatus Cryosericum sp.]
MAVFNGEYFSLARRKFVSFTALLPVERPPTTDQPPCYTSGPYATLYLLHGFSGSRSDWLTNTRIAELAVMRGLAVIMPDAGNNFYLDIEESLEYCGEFIGSELVDVTRRMFPLSHKREDTAIGGISMGGYGAVRNGLKYADTFGAILSHSAALITDEVAGMKEGEGNFMAPYAYYRHTFGEPKHLFGSDKDPKFLAKSCMEKGNLPKLFLACGSEDFLYAPNAAFHAYLESIGCEHQWWVKPGVHDFDFWNASLPASLDWLDKVREVR